MIRLWHALFVGLIRISSLFGLYAKGRARGQSDVDILMDSGLKGLSFVGLMEDVHTAVDKDIDLFDVRHVEKNSKWESEIQKSGVVLYEK